MSATNHQIVFDVIVVGAGPAGATLATRLGRAGFHVALLDRARFPRRKPCGEFMSPACLPILDDLGVRQEVLASGGRPVQGMEVRGFGKTAVGDYRSVGAHAPLYDFGYGLRREVFDEVLFRTASEQQGVEVLEGHRVVGLLRDPSGVVDGVRTITPHGEPGQLRARFTVGADGLRSRVARELGVRREIPWLKKFALVTRYRGVEMKPRAEAHLFPGGYFAACPVDDALFSVNLVVDLAAVPKGRDGVEGLFLEKLAGVPELEDALARATRVDPLRGVGPLASRTTEQVFDGAALVGDARGYVDPITGEGIYFALWGAEVLAEEVASALACGRRDRESLRGYKLRTRAEFAPRVLMGKLLQRGLRHPWIARNVLGLLQRRAGLMSALVSVTGDYVPPGELLRPRAWLATG